MIAVHKYLLGRPHVIGSIEQLLTFPYTKHFLSCGYLARNALQTGLNLITIPSFCRMLCTTFVKQFVDSYFMQGEWLSKTTKVVFSKNYFLGTFSSLETNRDFHHAKRGFYHGLCCFPKFWYQNVVVTTTNGGVNHGGNIFKFWHSTLFLSLRTKRGCYHANVVFITAFLWLS